MCVELSAAILEALPLHLNMMRSRGAVSSEPIILKLWEFNSQLTEHLEVELPGGLAGAQQS